LKKDEPRRLQRGGVERRGEKDRDLMADMAMKVSREMPRELSGFGRESSDHLPRQRKIKGKAIHSE
jgi:hypothetical protein